MKVSRHIAIGLIAAALAVASACEREQRRFRETTPPAGPIRQSDLQPGVAQPVSMDADKSKGLYDENAWAVSQGQQLYGWFNCVGCHSHGGGGMGPALMDDKWIYGSQPENIFQTIEEGRPNGMPSFRGKLNEQQVWQLAAYVRSMSGLLRKDISPSREDNMNVKTPEQSQPKRPPRSQPVTHLP
jgi:cytochrome c oxidase cbb3-type subunit 3